MIRNIQHTGDLDFTAEMKNGEEWLKVEFSMDLSEVSGNWQAVLHGIRDASGARIKPWWDWEEALNRNIEGTVLDPDVFEACQWEAVT